MPAFSMKSEESSGWISNAARSGSPGSHRQKRQQQALQHSPQSTRRLRSGWLWGRACAKVRVALVAVGLLVGAGAWFAAHPIMWSLKMQYH